MLELPKLQTQQRGSLSELSLVVYAAGGHQMSNGRTVEGLKASRAAYDHLRNAESGGYLLTV